MHLKSEQWYQILLIGLLGAVAALFGVFLLRELFPEYKVYQNAYVAIEEFRSSYTGQEPAPFKKGVKQLVMSKPDKGPETIDRCVSCHVALKLSHFSPTAIAKDINGNPMLDDEGNPQLVPNDEYVWKKVDDRIAELLDPSVMQRLEAEGKSSEISKRQAEAEELAGLKTTEIHGNEVDMRNVLAMHPLMGREEFPFEYHPMENFGCTSCHEGNGRGLVTDRAHGPVLDGQYDIEYEGPRPVFLESDPDNDPTFAKVFNNKPGHRLLFQTTPVYVGKLMEAKCVQCHLGSQQKLEGVVRSMDGIKEQKKRQMEAVQAAAKDEQAALVGLIDTKSLVARLGVEESKAELASKLSDYRLQPEQLDQISGLHGWR